MSVCILFWVVKFVMVELEMVVESRGFFLFWYSFGGMFDVLIGVFVSVLGSWMDILVEVMDILCFLLFMVMLLLEVVVVFLVLKIKVMVSVVVSGGVSVFGICMVNFFVMIC